jgi:ribonuclease J
MSNQLRIVPIGGCGEIGKNMTIFEMGTDAIIVDCGMMFPSNDMFGVDYIIPDFSYLRQRPDLKIHGILYTHGHEDHVGASAHLSEALPGVPVYATPLTAALIEVKLRERGILQETQMNVFKAGDIIKAGPFKVESFHVCHSIPDCVGFGINTPYGLIIHSGDYKFDNTPIDGKKPDYAKLAEFSKRGVFLLMGDSTNAESPGWTPSEQVVLGALDNIFRQATSGRIIVATFASHISRIQQVANLAARYGRKLAFAGHSMNENVKKATKIDLLDIPDNLVVELSKINSIRPKDLVIMATGSQGEPSAVLGRLARGTHPSLDVMEGDTIVLSAHTIPGNEELVNKTINRLYQRGADVIYDPIAPVHVSGHARQEEMRLLLSLTNPKFFVPVHGELRHLKAHRKLAIEGGVPEKNTFVVENGMVLEAGKYGIRVGERVPGGYVYVDGSGVGDIDKAVIRDREVLARDGFFIVVVNVDSRTGKLRGNPEIISRGFVYLKDADELIGAIRGTVIDALANSRNGNRRERLQENVSRTLFTETRRKPMVFTIINEQ